MADFVVTNTNDSGAGSLRQAVLNANSRNGTDRIIFDNSISGSTINLTSGQIRIADDLVLEGLNANTDEENITIDAGGNSRVFLMAEDDVLFNRTPLNVTIKRLNITGGFTASNGGAIFIGGDSLRDHNLTIERSIISNNSSGSDGGAIYYDTVGGNLSLFDTTIRDNSAAGNGGGIGTVTGNISLFLSIIQRNNAGGDGGGVYNSLNNVGIDSSLFEDNRAGGEGGGLNTSSTTILQSIFFNNQAVEEAGGISTTSATIILNSSIVGNETDGFGGGINISNFRNENNFFRNNIALIANTTISSNKAKRDGGGIWVSGGVLDQRNFLLYPANLVATNVTITDNVADSDNNGNGNGGGIFNTTYSRSDNIEFIPGNILLQNSILAGNFDTPDNSGTGFIAPDINGGARGNSNNLLGNTQGLTTDELFGVPLSESLGEGSDLKNIDPGLGELQIQTDNDTPPTIIHPLLPDSPAINAGNNDNVLRETFIDVNGDGNLTTFDFDNNPNTTNAQLPYDQRLGEFSRIVDGTVDIGAFEFQDIIEPCQPTNGDDDLTACATPNDDSIAGLEGNDTLVGGDGNDNLRGNGGIDVLNGSGGLDTLNGGGGRDTLRGQGGRDVLIGGKSNDVLIGGGGNDIFVFDTGTIFDSSDLGVDRILDFVVGKDKIRLSKDTFTALGNTSNGRLRNADFAIVTNNGLADNSNAEIVYNSSNGNLYYNKNNDADGFGSGGLFAKLIGSPDDLSATDFQVVDV